LERFAQQWLAIQCEIIADSCCALLVLINPDKSLQPLAQWPMDSEEPLQLAGMAQLVLQKGVNVINQALAVQAGEQACDYIASPILLEDRIKGVIALKIRHQTPEKMQQIIDSLEHGKKWLLAGTGKQVGAADDFYKTVVGLLAAGFEKSTFNEALISLITELSKEFACERVSIGEIRQHHSEVIALSNRAKFDSRVNLLRTIGNAMDEAIDQDMIIVYPDAARERSYINRAHAELARKYGSGSICTIPLVYQDSMFAVITLERHEENPFAQETVLQLEQTLSLLSPFLQLKHAEEKGWIEKTLIAGKRQAANLFGIEQFGVKLASLAILALLVSSSFIKGDFNIKADAVLEGKVQRVVAAPMQGFILTAFARAGDTVNKGALMAAMDDSDLKLEAAKLTSQLQQTAREYREAMAGRDLVKISLLSAQLEQTQAQLELVNEQLKRISIVAPFNGIVIEGDLSQKLGSPVERGDTLFKIAPLEGYRIVLKVNERLISHVQPGQSGVLALSSLPDKKFALTVEKITAVAKAEDGNNIFRVEANIREYSDQLRPGMSGVGKVCAGKKTLLWIWTHEFIDWVKIRFWSWWP
jgi:hypothetical protein